MSSVLSRIYLSKEFIPVQEISCLASCLGLVPSRICLSRLVQVSSPSPQNFQGLEFTTKDVVEE
jgi:hypothetical protein